MHNKITNTQAIKIAEYLKNGGHIGNGKVFSVSFDFYQGMYRKIGEDMREKEQFVSTYTYEEFIHEIQYYDKSEFVGLDKIV